MISVTINEIPKFMSLLFSSEAFDKFYISEASIKTFITYQLDGYTNKDFLGEEEPIEKYARWAKVRPICRELIKGKRTPLSMRFTFVVPAAETAAILKSRDYVGDTNGIHLLFNISFEGAKLSLVSASSTDTFLLDKSHDDIWDEAFEKYLKQLNIDFDKEV